MQIYTEIFQFPDVDNTEVVEYYTYRSTDRNKYHVHPHIYRIYLFVESEIKAREEQRGGRCIA